MKNKAGESMKQSTQELRDRAVRDVFRIEKRVGESPRAHWERVAVEQRMLVLQLHQALRLSILDTYYVEGVTPHVYQPAFQERFAKIKAALAAIDQEKAQ